MKLSTISSVFPTYVRGTGLPAGAAALTTLKAAEQVPGNALNKWLCRIRLSGLQACTQSLQNPFIKEYTLNYNRIPYMI